MNLIRSARTNGLRATSSEVVSKIGLLRVLRLAPTIVKDGLLKAADVAPMEVIPLVRSTSHAQRGMTEQLSNVPVFSKARDVRSVNGELLEQAVICIRILSVVMVEVHVNVSGNG